MIVIDASALIEVLLGTELGLDILERCAGSDLHAPHLIDLEVSNVVRRMVRHGAVPLAQGSAVVESLTDAPVQRWDHRDFLARAWELRDQLSSYDAVYIVMAESLEAPLVTSDAGMKAAISHTSFSHRGRGADYSHPFDRAIRPASIRLPAPSFCAASER